MEISKATPQNKELQNMEQLEGNKANAEAACTTKGAPVQNTEEETATQGKVPRKLLRKRAGKPSPTDIDQDLKKKKLESKIQDQEKAGSSKGEGKASKKEKQEQDQDQDKAGSSKGEGKASKKKAQEQEVFNVPQTPPRANDGPPPTTPEGRQQPPQLNPMYTPARPKGKSRLIKDEPLPKDSTSLD